MATSSRRSSPEENTGWEYNGHEESRRPAEQGAAGWNAGEERRQRQCHPAAVLRVGRSGREEHRLRPRPHGRRRPARARLGLGQNAATSASKSALRRRVVMSKTQEYAAGWMDHSIHDFLSTLEE